MNVLAIQRQICEFPFEISVIWSSDNCIAYQEISVWRWEFNITAVQMAFQISQILFQTSEISFWYLKFVSHDMRIAEIQYVTKILASDIKKSEIFRINTYRISELWIFAYTKTYLLKSII